MGNPSYQNHSAGPKQGVDVIPTFPYGNASIQQSLYVNAAMQSPHSAVPTTSRSMLKIDEFGRSWFKFILIIRVHSTFYLHLLVFFIVLVNFVLLL